MLYRHQMMKEIISIFTMNMPLLNQTNQENQISDTYERMVEDYVMFISIQ
jgi:hypothetical protein